MSQFSSQGIAVPVGRLGLNDPGNSRYRGIAVPFNRTPDGYFGAKGTRDVIWSSIVNILLTPIGTRIMIPEFGSRVPELVFEPNDDLLQAQARIYIFEAIQKWEPRVRLLSAVAYRDIFSDQSLHVDLSYEIVRDSTTDSRSLILSQSGQFATEAYR